MEGVKDNFLVPQQIDAYGQPLPCYDTGKERKLIEYFKDNPYYRITEGSQFITKKNPFELFYSEIYSLENESIINDLKSVEKLLNDANSCLIDYFKKPRTSQQYVNLEIFLVNVADIKKTIPQILSEKVLEDMTKK